MRIELNGFQLWISYCFYKKPINSALTDQIETSIITQKVNQRLMNYSDHHGQRWKEYLNGQLHEHIYKIRMHYSRDTQIYDHGNQKGVNGSLPTQTSEISSHRPRGMGEVFKW